MENIVSKADLMQLVYTQEELKRIDSAVPIELWETHRPIAHVMNYNEDRIFGRCENLFEVAEQRGIEIPEWFNRIKEWV